VSTCAVGGLYNHVGLHHARLRRIEDHVHVQQNLRAKSLHFHPDTHTETLIPASQPTSHLSIQPAGQSTSRLPRRPASPRHTHPHKRTAQDAVNELGQDTQPSTHTRRHTSERTRAWYAQKELASLLDHSNEPSLRVNVLAMLGRVPQGVLNANRQHSHLHWCRPCVSFKLLKVSDRLCARARARARVCVCVGTDACAWVEGGSRTRGQR
jgi:hypothetical protein